MSCSGASGAAKLDREQRRRCVSAAGGVTTDVMGDVDVESEWLGEGNSSGQSKYMNHISTLPLTVLTKVEQTNETRKWQGPSIP